ncbi:N-acetylmuramoyl-L-alanine amidase [Candidatus Falkowbacteria bacterium]|nr:N-acetylmuramoyl-L-alanine amidase [Candidatus Falkowbacteria bacterium]
MEDKTLLELEKVEYLIIHHSQRNNDWPAFVRFRHLYLRGWKDIGYHWLIGNTRPFTVNGKVYPGRLEQFQGAHALGYNDNSLGVCLIGDFDKIVPSNKQLHALFRLLLLKMSQYNIPVENVLGHRELFGVVKTCPGENIDMRIIREYLLKAKELT